MPSSCRTARVPRCTGLPISSVLVAAEAMWKFDVTFSLAVMSRSRNSAMGERQMLPWQTKSIFIILDLSLHKPSNLDITGFPTLFSFFVFCLKPTLFFINLRKFTGKWCSKWCSNFVRFQPDFLCFSCLPAALKSMTFTICSAARS